MKVPALFFSLLLGCGAALAQQSSGTVNSLSVDPEQNQKLSGSMGTTTGQANDVTRGADRSEDLGNPSKKPISGQASSGKSAKKTQAPGGSPSANQNSASTNSGKAKRRQDTNQYESDRSGNGEQSQNNPH